MALRLTRANGEYLSITAGIFDINSAYTVAGWVRFATATGYYGGVVTVGNGSYNKVDAFINKYGNFYGISSGGASDADGNYESVGEAGIWMHVAMVRSSATHLEYFVDGASIGVLTSNATGRDAATQFDIGVAEVSYYSDARYWGWKAWTRALTSDELSTESKQAMPVSGESLYGVWPFLAGATRTNDYSGNGHAWTEHNTPTDEDPPSLRIRGQVPQYWPPDASVGSGDISGTATVTLSGSGTLGGDGALAGSTAITTTGDGDLTGSGALSGATSITFAGSATGELPGDLTGTSTLTVTGTGELRGDGALVGTTTITFAGSATTTSDSALVGISTLTFTGTGELLGPGALSGISIVTIGGAGDLRGFGAAAGAGALAFSGTGSAVDIGPGLVSGTSSVSLSGAGALASGTSTMHKVALRRDFLNIVSSSSGTEIEITIDANGGMRFYLP